MNTVPANSSDPSDPSVSVVFRLDYQIGSGSIQTFWAFVEKYEGQYYQADLDLSSLVGQDIKFILTVLSTGSATGDRALWVGPVIYNSSGTSATEVTVESSRPARTSRHLPNSRSSSD